MAQTIEQLVAEMRTQRARLAADDAGGATGDVSAAIAALDKAIHTLSAAIPQSELASPSPIVPDALPVGPPYAVIEAEPGEPDNLTHIRGISSATATALAGLGLTRYAHIAGLTARDIPQLHDDLGYRCTVHRDNWIEQAAILARGGSTGFSRRGAPLPVPVAINKPDVTAAQVATDTVPDPASPTNDEGPVRIEIEEPAAAEERQIETAPAPVVAPVVPVAPVAPLELSAGLAGSLAAIVAGASVSTSSTNVDDVSDTPAPTLVADTPESVVAPPEPAALADPYANGPFDELLPAPEPTLDEMVQAEAAVVLAETVSEPDAIVEPVTAPIAAVLSEVAEPEAVAATQEDTAPLPPEKDTDPAPLIDMTDSDDADADDVFATLPEPIAVVARLAEATSGTPEPANTAPDFADIIEPSPAPSEPRAPIVPVPATRPEVAAAHVNGLPPHDSVDIAPPAPPVPLEPLADPTPPASLAASLADSLASAATGPIESPAPATPETVNRSTPLDFAPAEPVFAPGPGRENAAAPAFDEARVDIVAASDTALNGSADLHGLSASSQPTAMTSEPAASDPLPEPFSPNRTSIGEAEIVIIRNGEPEPPELDKPQLFEKGGLAGRISRAFRRKS